MLAPSFEHGRRDPTPDAILVPGSAGLVVTEGNYLLLDEPRWRAARNECDEIWQVTLDEPTRAERLVARHVAAGRSPAAARAWVDRVDQPNAALVEAAAERAERILDLTRWTGRLKAV